MLPKRRPNDLYKLTPELKEATDKAIRALLADLDLQQSVEARPLTGSALLETNSIAAYKKHLRGLYFFCSLVGDYDSLLILLECPPEPFCPSMSPSSIVDFIRFKRQEKGAPFFRQGSNQQCMDVFGNPVVCMGVLHSARNNHLGNFEDSCNNCKRLWSQQSFHGCVVHAGRPQLNAMKTSRKQSAGYRAKGDMALTPMEVQDIRQYLLTTNQLSDLRLFVMIIMSIKLFLCSDKILQIKVENLVPDVCVIRNDHVVESLAFEIQGKSDDVPVTLTLWADNDLPHLCCVRLLLAYIGLSGISNGYLFPGKSEGHIS
ncbi:hypothetical protein AeRB84_007935, partial [Aphanomyces euteiches]